MTDVNARTSDPIKSLTTTVNPRRTRPLRQWFHGAALSALLAGFCNLTLQLIQSGGNTSYLVDFFLLQRFGVFVLGSLVIWIILAFAFAVTGRLWLSTGLVFSASIVIGSASYQKGRLRREPIFPSDWAFADDVDFLAGMISGSVVIATLCSVILVLSIFVMTGRVLVSRYPRLTPTSHPHLRRPLVLSRMALAILCAASLGHIANFNEPGNSFRWVYEEAGAVWTGANQPRNYLLNGFIGGYLYNLNVEAMQEPEEYSAQVMDRIATRYSAVATEINEGRSRPNLEGVNVVLVLAEAFSDPLALEGITMDEDPIRYTRQLMTRTTSGRMLTQKVGSGTANMEFEALTSMSLLPFNAQMDTPYQMLVQYQSNFPSAVGLLRASGHQAVAVHPYNANMYQRRKVYPVLGFERFLDKTKMVHSKTLGNNPYISDGAAYAQTLDVIRKTESPLLLNLVTMQNHYAYEGIYENPLSVDGVGPTSQESIGQYTRGLKHSDDALKIFIRSIESLNEPTVVVFYGDHLPAGYPDKIFERNSERTMRETPFFIYSNFSTDNEQLPTTSPIHFMNHVFKAADAAIPPYYALLAELESEISAMEHGIMINAHNQEISEDQLSNRARKLLRDYRLVQYDLSVGKRYSQARMFYPMTETVTASGSGD